MSIDRPVTIDGIGDEETSNVSVRTKGSTEPTRSYRRTSLPVDHTIVDPSNESAGAATGAHVRSRSSTAGSSALSDGSTGSDGFDSMVPYGFDSTVPEASEASDTTSPDVFEPSLDSPTATSGRTIVSITAPIGNGSSAPTTQRSTATSAAEPPATSSTEYATRQPFALMPGATLPSSATGRLVPPTRSRTQTRAVAAASPTSAASSTVS